MRTMSLLLLLGVASASAQTSLTPDQRQAILDYQLTMPKVISLTGAMEGLSKYLASLANAQERGLRLATMSPAELRALTEKDPKAMGGNNNPAMLASPANVAFAKANLAQLKPKMDAVRSAARGK